MLAANVDGHVFDGAAIELEWGLVLLADGIALSAAES